MMTRRGEILDEICRAVGIRQRHKPKSPYLNKKELLHLSGWINTVKSSPTSTK